MLMFTIDYNLRGGAISRLSNALFMRVGSYIKQRIQTTLFYLVMGRLKAILRFLCIILMSKYMAWTYFPRASFWFISWYTRPPWVMQRR